MLTVCVVEDQDIIRDRIASLIPKLGDAVCLATFSNAEEALRKLPELSPTVTVMDVELPGMSGLDCMSKLNAAGYAGDFIVFTVFDGNDLLFRALELGASGYILKEEGARGVSKALREYRRGGAPMSRSIAQQVLGRFRKTSETKDERFESLTEHQRVVLELVAQGKSNKVIAAELDVTEATIKQHNFRIYKKLRVNSRASLVRLYHENQ